MEGSSWLIGYVGFLFSGPKFWTQNSISTSIGNVTEAYVGL